MARPTLPKLYPDLPVPLIGYLLADAMALLWAAGCYLVGDAIYRAIMTLSIIATTVEATGRRLDELTRQIEQTLGNVPLVGSDLRPVPSPLHNLAHGLVGQGQQELAAIQHVALLLGLAVGGIPLLVMLLVFIPWRVRKTRQFRALDRMLRQPGAGAVATTMQVLAGRALYTLPYAQLLEYCADPIGEWREGRYYNLARATMAREGLDLRRYLRRAEGLAPLPEPVHYELPTIDDEENKLL